MQVYGLTAVLTFDTTGLARFPGVQVIHPAEVTAPAHRRGLKRRTNCRAARCARKRSGYRQTDRRVRQVRCYAETEGGLSLSFDGLRERDRLVIWTALHSHIPVAIVLAGGYAANVQDTVTIHANTAHVAKEVLEKTGW